MGAKRPELCIALRQEWEECRRMAEEGEEGAGHHCTFTMGSLTYKGYRHSEVSLWLSMHSTIFVEVEVYCLQSLFHDRNPESGTLVTQSSPHASRSCNPLGTHYQAL